MADKHPSTRRRFLQFSALAVGTAALDSKTSVSADASGVYAGGQEVIRIGLVGCGGRGSGAVLDALRADPAVQLVAVGDVFRDQAERCLKKLKRDKTHGIRVVVDEEHVFSGFNNYQQVIDASDVVLLATPPHFRPQHLEYAIAQGKHAFVEKPVAVDAPGVRRVLAACRLAKEKQLSIVSGLCWRYDLGVRETMRKILEERSIGDIVAIESNYNANGLWHRGDNPEWSRMEYQLRNWLYYTWLAGDHIVEQAVHSLDKTAWLLGDIQPSKAMAMGGRQQRTQARYGNVYDHFTVFYEYPTGQHVYFTCRQQNDTSTRVEERVLGTGGQAEILRNQITPNEGAAWSYSGEKRRMYELEHVALFESIREGAAVNDGHHMCNSTMIGIMGRMSAYSGKTLTWDECFNSDQRLGPTDYAWSDLPEPEVAIPGKSQRS